MLKLVDLANRPDFQAGALHVSPALRQVDGPGGRATLEPIVMKVFLLLLEARGSVVTRDELFANAWGGVFVGDDSLNRAIARVRKIAAETAPGLFEIETIPRTGYRVTGKVLEFLERKPSSEIDSLAVASHVSRRALLGSSVAAAAALGGAGLWWVQARRSDGDFERLMQEGNDALRLDQPASAHFFQQATAIEPRNAKAWGLLAYSLASGASRTSTVTDETATAAERAGRKALQIDRNESNALLALTLIQSDALDWLGREERYRHILAIDPQNPRVMRGLGQLLHSVGRCRESLALVERALVLEPLAPDHWVRKALRLWILGRITEADFVIDRAMQFWPSHKFVRLGRLMIYAFTGRANAALAMVNDEARSPTFVTAAAVPVWRASLAALETRSPAAVAAARTANVEQSAGSPQIAAWAILTLSALGELDAAFDVANGFLLDRGSVIVRPRPDRKLPRINSAGWRNTYGLFTPPTRAMRLDPRFKGLCDGLGLTDYWRERGVGPDLFLIRP